MGNKQLVYSQPIDEGQPGQSQIRRAPSKVQNLDQDYNGMKTIQDIFLNSIKLYGKNNMLGTQVVTGENSRHYVYKTYDECYKIAEALGSGMKNLGLAADVNEYNDGKRDFKMSLIGIFSKNREEWLLVEFANLLYNQTLVPLYDTLGNLRERYILVGPDSIPFVLNQTGITTLFLSASSLAVLSKVKDLGKLKNLVTFDNLTEEQIKEVSSQLSFILQFSDKGLKVYTFNQVIDEGKKKILEQIKSQPEDIFTFSYTSGTTGNPKGVMLSHQNFACLVPTTQLVQINYTQNDVYLSYLPLPHVLERVLCSMTYVFGGTICFYRGDVMKIKDDLMLAKPTIFASVPRLYLRLYQAIKDKLDSVQGMKKKLIDQAYSSKLYYLQNGGYVQHRLWDQLVFNKTKEAFGGRVRLMITGSAPIAGEVLEFLKICVCCPIIEGYGQTETCGGLTLTLPSDSESGHVGGPIGAMEVKTVDVPEMNYYSTDKNEKGQLAPRGEICVRGFSQFVGYYKEKQKTDETIDKDGWLHTGDVGMIRPNGSIKIIDRVKNIFKLQQGEYIAPEKIENIYLQVSGITEVFVYGDSLQAFCVCIAVPDKQKVMHVAQEKGLSGTFEELCQNPAIVKYFLDELNAKQHDQGKAEKLNGMENVKKLYLEPVSFGVHGCLSNTMKLQRHQAKTKFQGVIDQMYK